MSISQTTHTRINSLPVFNEHSGYTDKRITVISPKRTSPKLSTEKLMKYHK